MQNNKNFKKQLFTKNGNKNKTMNFDFVSYLSGQFSDTKTDNKVFVLKEIKK